MKTFLIVLALGFSSVVLANLKIPTKTGDGFENINEKQEYEYSPYPNERIWYHFGRPYWRGVGTQVEKEVAVAKPAPTPKPMQKPKAVNPFQAAKQEKISLDVTFELGKAAIDKNFTKAIDELGAYLKENEKVAVRIDGHTDSTGNKDFNKQLSEQRAAAIKEYLQQKFGISNERLVSQGFGPEKPLASNETLEGRRLNRRVEVETIR